VAVRHQIYGCQPLLNTKKKKKRRRALGPGVARLAGGHRFLTYAVTLLPIKKVHYGCLEVFSFRF